MGEVPLPPAMEVPKADLILIAAGKGLGRVGVSAGQHGLRNPPAKSGTSKSSQFAHPFDSEASIGAKPATAGKGAGRGEVGIGRIGRNAERASVASALATPLAASRARILANNSPRR